MAMLETETTTTNNSFLTDLLSFVEEIEVAELNLEDKQGFQIETVDQANFIARKVKELRAEREEAMETAKKQIEAYQDKVNAWLESVTKPLDNQEAYYLNLLETFARTKLDGSNKKSLKLIEGTLQFRKQQPKYEYTDNVLLDYVKENLPDLIKRKVTESVDKTALKNKATIKDGRLYIDGKLIPGVVVEEQDDKFDVK